MKKLIIILFVCVATLSTSWAQRNYAFYSFQNLTQSHYYNPAMGSNYKVNVSLPLPMQSIGFLNSGFTINSMFTTGSDDSLYFDPESFLGGMKKINYLDLSLQNEFFGLGLNVGKNYFSFSAIGRTYSSFAYTKDFMELVFQGNGGDNLGRRMSMDGMGLTLNAYMEYALGFKREINDKLTVGGRIKFLSGIMNVTTKESKLGITTDEEDFSITIDGALDLRTSGFVPFISDSIQGSSIESRIFGFQNSGTAFDFGGTYAITDKLKVNASLLDLGSIKWTEDVYNYKREDVSYTFNGVDLNRVIKDSTYNFEEEVKDTLSKILVAEKNNDAYRQALPTRIIIGGQYEITKQLAVNSTLFSDFSNGRYRPALVIGGTFGLANWLKLSMNYMAASGNAGNIGMGMYLRGAGMQFYVSTDNIFGALNYTKAKTFHVSFGLGLAIGRPKDK